MTPIKLQRALPFKLVSLQVRGHQDDERDYEDLTEPKQLNVLANYRATAALKDLCAAGQPTEFYPAIFVMPSGISLAANSARSEPNSLSPSSGRTYKNTTIK
jgi:hypothetical protein